MSPLTLYLARFIGLGVALMTIAMALRPKATLAAIADLVERPGALMIAGVFTLGAGAAMVAGYEQWSAGPIGIVVTLLGWLTLIKGFAILVAPAPMLRRVWSGIAAPTVFRIVMIIAALLAIWLAWAACAQGHGVVA